MHHGPASNLEFCRHQVSVKVASTVQAARHRFHVPVNHIAGAISIRMLKSQQESAGFDAKFVNGGSGSTLKASLCPGVQFCYFSISSDRFWLVFGVEP